MCQRTPCLGTPHDILALIDAGYADQLSYSEWAAGMLLGHIVRPVPMVQIKTTGDSRDGCCVFYSDGKCELHDLGLKPTEGRLAHHEVFPRELLREYNLTYQVAREWMIEENLDVIREIVQKLKEHLDKKEKMAEKKKVYISGKMRYMTEEESRALFLSAQRKLEAEGFEVVNPWDFEDEKSKQCSEWSDYIMFDLPILKTCDIIYMLPNWNDSCGANVEHWYAKGHGIEIRYAQEPNSLESLKQSIDSNDSLVCFGCFYDRKNKKYFAVQKGEDSIIEKMLRHAIVNKVGFATMLKSVLDLLSVRHARPKGNIPNDFFEIFDKFKK